MSSLKAAAVAVECALLEKLDAVSTLYDLFSLRKLWRARIVIDEGGADKLTYLSFVSSIRRRAFIPPRRARDLNVGSASQKRCRNLWPKIVRMSACDPNPPVLKKRGGGSTR